SLFIGLNPPIFATPVFIIRAAPFAGIGDSNRDEQVTQLHGAGATVTSGWDLTPAILSGLELGAEHAVLVAQKDNTMNREMLTWTTQQIYAGVFGRRRLAFPWSMEGSWRYGLGPLRQQ